MPAQSGNHVEASPVVVPEPVSNVQPASNPASAAPNASPAMRNPDRSTEPAYPAWVVCGDTLTQFEGACRLRDNWRVAVAWRAARARRRPADGGDLAADPEFQRMVFDRYSWAEHRRH